MNNVRLDSGFFISIKLVLFMILMLVHGTPVSAQDEPSLNDSSVASEAGGVTLEPLPLSNPDDSSANAQAIFNRTIHQDERTALLTTYKGQIEKYRTSEKNFTVAKQQYRQLQTLVSLEEAVRATREVMLDRANVMVTYLEFLRLQLQDMPGIDLTLKQQTATLLEETLATVRAHQDEVLLTEDRILLEERAKEFQTVRIKFDDASNRTLILIKLGQVQTVYDQSTILFSDIQAFHNDNPGSALRNSQRTRAREELSRNIEDINKKLQAIKQAYKEFNDEDDKVATRNLLDRNVDELSSPYANLSKVITRLKEFITI